MSQNEPKYTVNYKKKKWIFFIKKRGIGIGIPRRKTIRSAEIPWDFSPGGGSDMYAFKVKYVTNIIGEPNYKYGHQGQVTVRNRNISTALERSVLKYWEGA